MTAAQLEHLKDSLEDGAERESAAFLTAGHFGSGDGGTHLTVRDILVPAEGDYETRTGTRLRMSPAFFSGALSRAEADGVTVIQTHTHPFAGPYLAYSQTDFEGETESAGTVRRSLGDVPMGSLLFGGDKVIGRIWTADGRCEPLHQLRVVGRRLTLLPMSRQDGDGGAPVDASLYDRQIRAFGEEGQRALSSIRVGVAGAGGVGSAVAEQLARAGVKRLAILDSDEFEPSNMTRMYGTDAGTRRGPKAGIVGDNVRRIAPDAEVKAARADICSQEALALLRDCDVVFGCVDREEPRAALNDLAYRFFVPVIDAGMGIDAEDGRIAGGAARAGIAAPSLPCLRCSGVIGPRGRRRGGGLGCGRPAPAPAPSVVPLTTMAASLAVLLLKDMLFGFAESDSPMLAFDLRTLSAGPLSPRTMPGCTCAPAAGMGYCAAASQQPPPPPSLRPPESRGGCGR